MKLNILIFLIHLILNYDQINVFSTQKTQTCIHETFSKDDHILIKYNIQKINEKENGKNKNPNQNQIQDRNFLLTIYNSKDQTIHEDINIKGKFNVVVEYDDVYSICLQNKSLNNAIVYYEFLTNIDLKDYSKVPNYHHYDDLENELNEIEGNIRKIESFINLTKESSIKNIKDSVENQDVSNKIINFSIYLILIILLIKLIEVYFIKKQLNQKKLA